MYSLVSILSRVVTLLTRILFVLAFPLALPVLVAANYYGLADRLANLPGIQSGGGAFAGIAVFGYITVVVGIASGTMMLALNNEKSGSLSGTNVTIEESTSNKVSTPIPTANNRHTDTPTNTPDPTSIGTSTKIKTKESNKYELLLSDIKEVYPMTARNSYKPPYLSFLSGSYNIGKDSVSLNFSMDAFNSIDRYESTVARTSGIYVWSHFNEETAYPQTATINYFRNGGLNATAKVYSR